MKILITGGLGYIGTELCKLYKNSEDEVLVIDNRFMPERVKWLKSNKIKYQQINIINDNKLKKVVEEADIVFHLAGITDVAYTKTEERQALNDLIKDVGIDGTKNILKYANKKTKLIFPSTHVVFEGHEEVKHNLKEDDELISVLTYSSVKVQNEKDIKNNNENYIILRLGSVYGYNDNVRYRIVPNLFSKMSALGETINLFGGGEQLKSIVSVSDVARCMKFMVESNIKNEVFHLVNEQMTIKEISYICDKIKKTNIIITDNEIPNKGYTLSNKKLLHTGFKFKHNIDTEIKKMIKNWNQDEI